MRRHLNNLVSTRLHFVQCGASVRRQRAHIYAFPCEGIAICAIRVTENPEQKKVALCEAARSERTCITGVAGFNKHSYGLPLVLVRP